MTERGHRPAEGMLPAGVWMSRIGWGLTAVALALNLLNLPAVCRTASKIHNAVGVLWMFGSPFALGLTIGCALAFRLRRRAVTRRGALLWVLLAFVSVAAFPLSWGATTLLSYDTWFGHDVR